MKTSELEHWVSYLEENDEECMEPDKILECIRVSENACAATEVPVQRARLLYVIGIARCKLGEFERGRDVLEEALAETERCGLSVFAAKINCCLSKCWNAFGDAKRTRKYSETALREFGRLHLRDELALHYINVSKSASLVSDKDELMEYLHRAEHYCSRSSTPKSARAHFEIARQYKNILKDYIKGAQFLTKGIEICRVNGMARMEALGMKRLADTYLTMERYAEAAKLYRALLKDDANRLPDSVHVSALVNLIFCNFHLGRLSAANHRIQELETFLPRLWKKERRQFTAVAHYLRARLLIVRTDKFQQADELLEKALAIYEDFGRHDFPVAEFDYMLYSLQASILLRQGRLGGAERACKKLADVSSHCSAMCRREAYASLANLAELKGDYEAACRYAHREDEAIASIDAANLAMRFEQMCRKFFDTMRSREISELQKENMTLERSIDIDALTQVYNKKYYLRYLRHLYEGERSDINQMTILMVDIDHFKEYNDCYGHPVGDRCLKKVARIFKDSVKGLPARIMRYGGEEFAIFLENLSKKDGEQAAQRILNSLAEQHIAHETSPVADYLTVSIGVASERRNMPREINALMERADEALYEAKKSGGNTFRAVQW
ncbi:diguanylate cyclase domain-containing protein [Schwartzia sp. (in: firmicutes)]